MLGIPVPAPLKRTDQAWAKIELAGKTVILFAKEQGTLSKRLPLIIEQAGAQVAALQDSEKVNAIIFDATQMAKPSDLDDLYSALHSKIGTLAPNGRVLVISKERIDSQSIEQHSTIKALEGFTRALAKEIGSKGSTANLVTLGIGVEQEKESWKLPLLFLLSQRSAFISGQVFHLNNNTEISSDFPLEKSLNNKVALVTGASRGIGKAIATKLAREGATVIVNDREQEADAAKALAQQLHGDIFLADVSQADTGQKIAQFCLDKYGGLDILVHNAGITRDKTLRNMSEAQWQQVMNINLRAVLKITDSLKTKALRKDGRIISLSSVSGIAGNLGQTNYSATKAGLIGFSEALAQELAPRGITVNAIAPGFIETQMTAKIPFVMREAGRRLSNLAQGGLPEDVADLATFLSMPGACAITGQTLRVCGGALVGK